MRPEYFSEFSYGFAVTAELVNGLGSLLAAPPQFPSLLEEGGVGWDVFLKQPTVCTYYQFKVSEFLFGPQAGERYLFNNAYYRFHLRTKPGKNGKCQHELLRELEAKGNEVLYIAPGFYDKDKWEQFYFDGRVVERSICFSPNELGVLAQDGRHWVVFQDADDEYGWLCSEPERRPAHSGKNIRERIHHRLATSTPLRTEVLEPQLHILREVAEFQGSSDAQEGRDLQWVRQMSAETREVMVMAAEISRLAQAVLDCAFLLVTTVEPTYP